MRRGLQSYHLAWLAAHPERDEAWLADRFRDGFQIHHVDGNHGNDAPENLVLIDGEDHFRIHGGRNTKLSPIRQKKTGPSRERLERGRIAYDENAAGKKWGSRQNDYAAAMAYARSADMPWPPKARMVQ